MKTAMASARYPAILTLLLVASFVGLSAAGVFKRPSFVPDKFCNRYTCESMNKVENDIAVYAYAGTTGGPTDQRLLEKLEDKLLDLYEKHKYKPTYVFTYNSQLKNYIKKQIPEANIPFTLKASLLFLIGDIDAPTDQAPLWPKDLKAKADDVAMTLEMLCNPRGWPLNDYWAKILAKKLERTEPYGYSTVPIFARTPECYDKIVDNAKISKENKQRLRDALDIDVATRKQLVKNKPLREREAKELSSKLQDYASGAVKMDEDAAEDLLADLKHAYRQLHWSAYSVRRHYSFRDLIQACSHAGVSMRVRDSLVLYLRTKADSDDFIIAKDRQELINKVRELLHGMVTGKVEDSMYNMLKVSGYLMELQARFSWKLYDIFPFSTKEKLVIDRVLGPAVDRKWRQKVFGF